MKLVTIDAPPDGRTGVLVGDEVLDFARAAPVLPLAEWIPRRMPALLAGGVGGLDLIRQLIERVVDGRDDEAARLRASGALAARDDVTLCAPVPRPGILLSHGRAYASHSREMRGANAKSEGDPTAFMKNIHAIIGPDAPIVIPRQCPDMIDFEGEFSLVFGKPCHNVSEDEALDAIAGYTIVNDVSARDWAKIFTETRDPDLNRMGKQLPTFAPMGPAITTADEVPDPHDLNLTTTLNGAVMQSAHTSDLIWSVRTLISYFSRWYPFQPGDILTTGTPAGVGYGRNPKVFMKAGDVVAITVDRVGTLRNPVVAPRD